MLLYVFLLILVIGIFLLIYTNYSVYDHPVLGILGFVCSLFGAAVSLGCIIAWTVYFISADEAYKEDLARYESIISTLDKVSAANIAVKDMNPVDFEAVTTAYDEMKEWNTYVLDRKQTRDSIWVGFIVPKYFDDLMLIDENKYADFAYETNTF